jgi:integrase
MSDAGLRVSEVTTLRWSDFDFRKKTLTVNSLKNRGPKAKPRTIPLSDRLYDSLAKLIEKHPPEDKDTYLFHRAGKPIGWQSINNTLKKLQHKSPEVGHLHPHKLRHTFTTNLAGQRPTMPS